MSQAVGQIFLPFSPHFPPQNECLYTARIFIPFSRGTRSEEGGTRNEITSARPLVACQARIFNFQFSIFNLLGVAGVAGATQFLLNWVDVMFRKYDSSNIENIAKPGRFTKKKKRETN